MLAILRVVTRSFPSLSHLACGASSLFSPSSFLPSHTLCSSNSNSRSSSTAHNSSMAASTKAAAIERVWVAPPCLHPAAADSQQQQQQQPRRLMLYNSLVDEKVAFVPAAGEGSSQISCLYQLLGRAAHRSVDFATFFYFSHVCNVQWITRR